MEAMQVILLLLLLLVSKDVAALANLGRPRHTAFVIVSFRISGQIYSQPSSQQSVKRYILKDT